MLRLSLILIVLLATASPAFGQQSGEDSSAKAPAMEFAGVNQFWEVASVLKQDRAPSAEMWSALFSAPGYRHYFTGSESKGEKRSFKRLMRTVFMPSREAALRDTLQSVKGSLDFGLRPLYGLLETKRREAELKRFQKQLAGSDLPQKAASEAVKLLPDRVSRGEASETMDVPIAFNFYKMGGTGTPDGVIADLLFSEKRGQKGLRLFLAHEMHHAARDRLSRLSIPEKGDDPRYYLLTALNQLQAEGIADRIDKPYTFSSEGPSQELAGDDGASVGSDWFSRLFQAYAERYQQAYDATPKILQRVDSLIVAAKRADAAGDEKALAENAEAVYRALPNNAHPNGRRVADLIAEQLGEKALTENVANPFAFIRLYNRAARQKEGATFEPFSREAMEYLTELEDQYIGESQ